PPHLPGRREPQPLHDVPQQLLLDPHLLGEVVAVHVLARIMHGPILGCPDYQTQTFLGSGQGKTSPCIIRARLRSRGEASGPGRLGGGGEGPLRPASPPGPPYSNPALSLLQPPGRVARRWPDRGLLRLILAVWGKSSGTPAAADFHRPAGR